MISKVIQHGTAGHAEAYILPAAEVYRPIEEVAAAGEGSNTAAQRQAQTQAQHQHLAETAAQAAVLQNQIVALQSQIAQVERDALERGRQQGHAQAQAELGPVLQRMQGAISDTLGLRTQLRKSTERDLIQLALAIAKRVLHRELQVDDNALGALARFAFDRMSRAEKYRIRVNPRFSAAIEQNLPRRQDISVHIDADPTCAPGTLEIQTDQGGIDASVDSQLDEIARGLVDRIG